MCGILEHLSLPNHGLLKLGRALDVFQSSSLSQMRKLRPKLRGKQPSLMSHLLCVVYSMYLILPNF